MSLKSSVLALVALFLMLSQGAAASAATITRDTTTGSSPNATDFPSAYNNHPSQVSYRHNTAIRVGENTMFRETIPIVCDRGQRLAGIGMTFRLMKLRDGGNAGNNDTLNFWVNGQNRYEFNIGEAATTGSPVVISIDLGALPPVGAGPNTLTALSAAALLGNPPSMIPDIRNTQRLSFAVQDDTNINYATVNYTCERDPAATPPEPLVVDPCCPPWNPTALGNSLEYVGSGSINAPYTLKFTPSPALINSLQAYLNYINTTNSALTSLQIEFQLYHQGPTLLAPGNNGTAVGPVSGMTLTANLPSVQLQTNYNTNTPAIFAGVSTPGTATTPSSYPMQVGQWYLFHSGMWTDSVPFFDRERCANVDVFVRVSFLQGARQRTPSLVLELRNRAGTISRTIRLPVTR